MSLSAAQKAALGFIEGADNALGRIDYLFFLHHVLGYGRNKNFWQFTDPRVQAHLGEVGKVINQWLDHRHEQRTAMKVIDCRPRETLKSGCITTPLPIYAHLAIPDISVGVLSMNDDKADKFSSSIRTELEGVAQVSRLTDLFGKFHGTVPNRQWAKDAMVTDRRVNHKADPTVSNFTVKKSPVSGHFDLFIVDDPTDFQMMENDADFLEKVWSAYMGLKFVVNRDGLLYIIMTRYHEADLIGRIIREEIEPRVRQRTWLGKPEGELPSDWDYDRGWIKYAHLAGWTVFYDQAVNEEGESNYPVIWPIERINEVRTGSPAMELYYWTQLQNSPQKREDKPINEEHIKMARSYSRVDAPKTGWVDIHCDFAFKRATEYMKRRGDYSVAHACVKKGGQVWRIEGFRGRFTQDMFGEKLIRLAYWCRNEWQSRIRFLSFDKLTGQGAGDESTKKWIWNLFAAHPDLNIPSVYEVLRRKDKIEYILSTAWAWQEGWVRLCKEAEGVDPLCHQALYAGYTEHDDDIDAFSASFWKEMYEGASRSLSSRTTWDWKPAVDIGQEDDDTDVDWGGGSWQTRSW